MMDKEERKPDSIVWSKEKGYFASKLSYGSNISAPSIKLENVKGWRIQGADGANQHFGSKFDEIKRQMESLLEEYNWNETIYRHADYTFQPTVGKTYHLYEREDTTLFLSMIGPNEWNQKTVGSFRLESTGKWIKT